jgi:hypothetical protein
VKSEKAKGQKAKSKGKRPKRQKAKGKGKRQKGKKQKATHKGKKQKAKVKSQKSKEQKKAKCMAKGKRAKEKKKHNQPILDSAWPRHHVTTIAHNHLRLFRHNTESHLPVHPSCDTLDTPTHLSTFIIIVHVSREPTQLHFVCVYRFV